MKTTLIRISFTLIFLVVFNALFFLLSGTDNPLSVWVSYAFVHVGYFTILLLPIFKNKGEADFYLSANLYGQAITYFLLELIIGVVFIIWRQESPVWPLVVQSILWLIFTMLILGNAWANQATSHSLAKREQELNVYQSMRKDLRRLLVQAGPPELKTLILACSDALESSSTRQAKDSEEIDAEIGNAIYSLKQSMACKDDAQSIASAKQLQGLINERKTILKYSH